jgi:uncharacterized repeat protein (TIGR02543 family)
MKKIALLSVLLVSLVLVGCTPETPPIETSEFEVTWIDELGNELNSSMIEEGDIPSYTYDPTDTEEWDYTFDGWSTTQDGNVLLTLPAVTEDVSYYAVVSEVKQQYTVTFETNDGSLIDPVIVDYGTVLTSFEATTKTSYNFLGWTSDVALTESVLLPYTVTEDVTLYANWEAIEYDITWYDELGNEITVSSVLENGTVAYAYNPTDTQEWDYTFEGWSDSLGGTVITTLPNATSDASYYAVVSQEKQQYTISFEENGGTEVTNITVDYGTETTTLDESTKEGFSFISWTTDGALTTNVVLPLTVTEDITLYASWNEVVPFGTYLQTLLTTYSQNPFADLPDSMLAANFVVDEATIIDDYSTSFVNVADINYHAFGEQWDMVLANMYQTSVFSDLLSVVELLSTTSIVAYNNFLDTNPANAEYYQFTEGIYTITIEVDGDYIYYLVEYTGSVPGLGEQVISMELGYDFVNNVKETRIQIGNDNVLKYEVSDDYYKFGISYLGFRDAYFEMNYNEDGSVEGAIFEYLTYQDYSLESAAQFLIDDEYVYVVGNKASGIPGFAGTIVEVYDVTTGELIGYEVQETIEILSVDVTFNTMWFKLEDQTGITNIKVLDVVNELNMDSIYVNDSVDLFESMLVGGLFNTKQASRRYDIEMRTMYVYVDDSGTLIKVQIEVPMLFVQEENMDTLEDDLAASNDCITTFTLDIAPADITLIQDAYVEYVPIFITNKENIDYTDIRVYLDLPVPTE